MSEEANESAGDGSSSASAEPVRVLAAVLRMDLKESEAAVHKDEDAFLKRMNLLRGQAKVYRSCLGTEGGEGDSIRQAFTNLRDALKCAFYLRNAAQQPIESKDGPYILEPRIVLHFGEFTKNDDRIEGLGQILVTRLDHAVPPGEIWATEAFADIARHVGADKGYSFEYVGQRELAKQSRKHPCYAVELIGRTITSDSLHRPSDPVELAMRLFEQGDQVEAISALGTINSELASRHLMDIALNSEVDRRVRHSALASLQERGGDIDIERIGHAFTNESTSVETRALLLLVLGATRSEEIIGTLSDVITKQSPRMPIRLREAALLAMRNLGGSLAAEAVQNALNDSEDLVRIAACVAAASGRMPIGVQTRLDEIVRNDEIAMDLRSVACEALSVQQITKKLIEILEVLVLNRDLSPTLRRYALSGLAQSDDPVAVRAVEEIARRTDELRMDAIPVLAAMRAPRRERYRRPRQRGSSVAEVIELRTQPQEDADNTDAL